MTLLSAHPRRNSYVHPRDYRGLESRFLQGLSPTAREAILASALERRLPSGSVITNQEEPARHLFMLLGGLARHYFSSVDGAKQLLFWLRPGDIVGGMSLLSNGGAYLVSTELLSASVLAVWEREKIRRLTSQYPVLLDNSLIIASDYLTWYVATHAALRCRDARQRLHYIVTSLARGFGRTTVDGIELDITNEELANAAGVSYFTVSRLLSIWQRTGAVSKSRGKLCLKRLNRL